MLVFGFFCCCCCLVFVFGFCAVVFFGGWFGVGVFGLFGIYQGLIKGVRLMFGLLERDISDLKGRRKMID